MIRGRRYRPSPAIINSLPEYRARAERAMKEPGFTVTKQELEALIESDDPQAAAALIAKKRRSA